MKTVIKQTAFVAVLFTCILSMFVVASDKMPEAATPEETCSCAGKGPECDIAIFQVDDDRKAYCALWTRKSGSPKSGCCMVDPKRQDPTPEK